jgi:hypothetical protein
MTKISKLRGFDSVPEQMPLVNYLTTTEGEFALQLQLQKLALFHHVFPEKNKIWVKGARMIDNALYNSKREGVHGSTPYFGTVPPELYFVAKKILDAKTKFAPAADVYIGRKDKAKGLNVEAYRLGINGADLAFTDIHKELERIYPNCVLTTFTDYDENGGIIREYKGFENTSCNETLHMMMKLNNILPKNSHNGIYSFMPKADANNLRLTPSLTVSKVNDHIKYFNALAGSTKISNTNIKDWLRNCVMHKNAYNNIPSLTPEDNIMQLRNNPNWSTAQHWDSSEQDKIGCVVFCIILIIIVAAKALGGLIQICKDKEPTAFQGLDDIALRAMDFASSGTDFAGLGGGNGGDDGTMTEAKCKAKTGYEWNAITKTCDKIDTGGGGNGGGNSTPSKEWIDGVPNIAVIGGGALLAGALLLK